MDNKHKKTGLDWSKELKLTIQNPLGWSNPMDFSSRAITKVEFFNRAANSVVKSNNAAMTRRDAAKLLKKI